MSRRKSASPWSQSVQKTWTNVAHAWEDWEPLLTSSMAAVDPALIRALELKPGLRVLDFGCGLGDPALSVAQFVSPRGRVTAVDVSRGMIAAAKRRARARGIRNVDFRVADVTQLPLSMRFDRIVARYGIMFPEDVGALLGRLRRQLRPRGRVAFAVWGPRGRNAYFRIVSDAVEPYLLEPPPPASAAPHAMRFANPQRLVTLLENAGYRGAEVVGVKAPFVFANEGQYAEAVTRVSGSTQALLRRVPRESRARIMARLRRGARRYRNGRIVRLPGFSWVVSAKR